ncbi:MAG: transglutaminase domain-containing protein [Pyrinomonadaceae bacterium]
MNQNKFIKDKNGFYRATMENVPAIKQEAQMPPEDEVRSWLLLYYWDDLKDDTSDFWSKAGGVIARVFDIKDTLKPNKEIKTAAAEISAGASGDDEKLAKLFEFCRTKVKNVTYDTTLTDEQKEEIKPSKSTSDTYKKLQGTENDINELFASLATGLGFESRLAFGGDRSQKFFNPNQSHVSFVHFSSIAVKVNNQWRYFDPGNPFVPYGMLAWNEENTTVLLLGYKDYVTMTTPGSGVNKSLAKRTGKFKLLEDGTLEGNVKIEYSGQLGYEHKMDNYESSVNKREEDLKDEIKKQFSTAELSSIGIENVTDPQKPFIYQYKIRIPNYAQKTGKRLFLQPGFFEYGKSPLFSTVDRKYSIYFHYPWSEEDNITIELPKGFALDNAEKPSPIADSNKISSDTIDIKIDNKDNTLVYNRNFFFGGGDVYLFPVGAYPALKNLFDEFHKADTHTITLKQN